MDSPPELATPILTPSSACINQRRSAEEADKAEEDEKMKPVTINNCQHTTCSQELVYQRYDANTLLDRSNVSSNTSESIDPNDDDQAELHKREILSDEDAVLVWTGGRSQNICSLLVTLHLLPWPGLHWRPLTMQQLLTTADVRRAYHRACRAVHPDHHMATSRENLASLVTKELNMAWLEFGNRHDYQTTSDWVHFD